MSKFSRRALLGSASIAALAALPPLEVLAAIPGDISSRTSDKSLSELAEGRRLIAAMIANDREISAAEEADDKEKAEVLEEQHEVLYQEFMDFANEVQSKPPRTWLDIVIRAEIAGYMLVWDKSRSDWETLLEQADNDGSANYPGTKELVMAVLYLAAREGGQAHA